MLPATPAYFLFLGLILVCYWLAGPRRLPRLAVLLFANYFFLARFSLWYLLLIPAASTSDYFTGALLGRLRSPLWRRVAIGWSVAVNLTLLLSVRYAVTWFPQAGRSDSIWTLFLPVSLSFYAFQSLTYTLDIYHGYDKPAKGYLEHLAAASFFPSLPAGPINRMSDLIQRLARVRAIGVEDSGWALFLIGLGLTKKLLIADYLASNLVGRVFDLPALYSGFEVLVGVLGYALQLYYDFSGYTDVATGAALLFGIKVARNFDRPYQSADITEFWKRWHISFSGWLRDYLYFALPGKRTRFGPYLNLIITMVLGGLWHGLTWNFAIWGALHGGALAANRRWQVSDLGKRTAKAPWARTAGVALTLPFVCFAWIFFRAATPAEAWAVLSRIGSLTFSAANLPGPVLLVLGLAAAGHWLPKGWRDNTGLRFSRAPFWVQAAAMVALLLGLQALAGQGSASFVYTRF